MGDFNARLARAYDFTCQKRVVTDDADLETEVTGCWSVHKHDDEMGAKLRDYLLEFDLLAVSTYFQPKRKKAGPSTYEPIQSKKGGPHRKGATLDTTCFSKRYRTLVRCKIRWGPSEERWDLPLGRGMKKDHTMLVMTVRLRLAERVKVQRHDHSSLRTRQGAELAAAAYAVENNKPAEGFIVEDGKATRMGRLEVTSMPVDRWSLHRMPRAGPLGLEELGLRVSGPAQGTQAPLPASNQLNMQTIGLAGEGGVLSTEAGVLAGCGDQIAAATSEQIAAATDQLLAAACEPPPAVFGLDAGLKRLERCCTAGLAALPHAEKTKLEAKRQSTSARTRGVKERQKSRIGTLLSEGKEQSPAERKEYYAAFNGSARED
jgi:hypothetical protein